MRAFFREHFERAPHQAMRSEKLDHFYLRNSDQLNREKQVSRFVDRILII
jgi:hypothetical protein